MSDWIDEVMADLAAARGLLDRCAARLESHRTVVELRMRPFWTCGHRHASRGEAIACLKEQAARATGHMDGAVEIPHEGSAR